jgi:hypothetical protein
MLRDATIAAGRSQESVNSDFSAQGRGLPSVLRKRSADRCRKFRDQRPRVRQSATERWIAKKQIAFGEIYLIRTMTIIVDG